MKEKYDELKRKQFNIDKLDEFMDSDLDDATKERIQVVYDDIIECEKYLLSLREARKEFEIAQTKYVSLKAQCKKSTNL